MEFYKYLKEENEKIKNWNFILSNNKMLSKSIEILKIINKKGYKAYIVGGTVRDLLLNKPIHDVDIATNMPLDELQNYFETYEVGKSKDFGIVNIKYKGFDYEIANFRTETGTLDKRHPSKIKIISDFKTDAKRRDITINSLGLDYKGNIYDYTGGLKDLKLKKITSIGDPNLRFNEDLLRILRVARFSSKLGFEIDKDTAKAAKKLAKEITKLPYEKIKDEIFKAASYDSKQFAEYLKILDKLGILRIILPELFNLKNLKQPLNHHLEGRGHGRSVYSHVLAALENTNTTDPIKNLAITLHDIGKIKTLSFKDGLETYHDHAKQGIDLVIDIANRLKLSNKDRDSLIFAVANHMKFHEILKMKPSKIFKLANDENWDILVAVAKADEYARGKNFKYSNEFEKTLNKAIEIKEKWGNKNTKKSIKLVDGRNIIKLTGLKPGPTIGKIIREITEWIYNNNINPSDITTINKKIKELGNKYK